MSKQLTSTKSKWSMALAAILLICAPQVWAQTLGDYRSVATGSWSSNSTWQYYNGSAWVAATSYPGEIASINNVTLQSPFTITLDVDPNFNGFQMVNMIVNLGASLVDTAIALSYQVAPTTTFVVNGTVDLDNTTTLTSSVYSATFNIGSTGILSAHVVFLVAGNNSGTATITQRIVNLAAINAGTNQGIWINLSNSTLNFGGTTLEAGLRADNTGNTVNYYSASGNQTIRTPIINYRNLTLSGNGSRTKTLAAATTVAGTVAVQGNSNFSLGGFNLSVGGDWNYSSTGVFSPLTNTVTFNGSIQQNVINTGSGSGTTFYDVTINNTFSTSPQINILTFVTFVDQTLTMLQGNINLNGNNLLHGPFAGALAPLVHSGLASAGWIYGGSYRRSLQNGATIPDGSVNGLFPVGTSQNFRPLYISSPTVAVNNGLVFVTPSSATNVTDVNIADTGGPIVRQHQGRWLITSTATTGLFNINAGGTGFLYIGNVNDLRLSLASSVVGSAGVNSGTTIIPFVQRTGLTPAQLSNTFYLGSVNKTSSPLPVELITFAGEQEGASVNLRWTTRTELSCDYFTVYRSRNGIDFLPVGTQKGAGTTKEQHTYQIQDQNPWQGINYYRLEQTDFDGTKNSLSLISVEANGTEAIQFYPSQLSRGQNVRLQLQGLAPQAQLEIHLVNATGQTMDQYPIKTDQEGRFFGDVQIGDISAGFYYLKLNQTIMKILIY
jgi:hypothetical protein